MPATLTKQQVDKLGNTLIYLSSRVGEFNKTKILKLLFLLDESSIKKYGYPFLGFDYYLWQHGPVLKEVFIDLSEELELLKDYIKRNKHDANIYEAAKDFSDDEFSDNDISLMDDIIKFAKNKTAKDLVDYTHNENSLWQKSAIKNGVYEQLKNKKLSYTDHTIDFLLLFEDDNVLKERYESSLENLEFKKKLKFK
ncbi:MAG: SocA family protein [Chitinophagaceae bacterium]|nr:SocA family protein [Chitinophagaceae bacterium]